MPLMSPTAQKLAEISMDFKSGNISKTEKNRRKKMKCLPINRGRNKFLLSFVAFRLLLCARSAKNKIFDTLCVCV